MPSLDTIKHAWNIFRGREPTFYAPSEYGYGGSFRQDRRVLSTLTDKTIVPALYNRIALDVAAIDLRHVQLDQNGMFLEVIKSGLNECLSLEANIDESGRELIMNIIISLCDTGVVAVVPTETTTNPNIFGSYDIKSMRVAEIKEWRPRHIRIEVYNDTTGKREEMWIPKSIAAIITNPLYTVMNEPNSTAQRLIRKLSLLDAVDEQSGSGKLDVIIQLPYSLKSQSKKDLAASRKGEIENQLKDSKLGIAYLDATERITQLNRPADNNLLTTIEYLQKMLYNQLGITESVFDGTADEEVMLNYYNRTLEPFLQAISEAMIRKFLTKTARSQNKTIRYFRDPFKYVPVTKMADAADRFTRNEVVTSNEMRDKIGMKPSADPRADQLVNKNLRPAGDTNSGDSNQNEIKKRRNG